MLLMLIIQKVKTLGASFLETTGTIGGVDCGASLLM